MPHKQPAGKAESEYVLRKKAIRALRIPGGGPSERAVLAVLLSRLPHVYASEEVLAAEAWCSTSTFKRACRVLVEAGVVEVDRLANRGAFGATNAYRVAWARVYELAGRIDVDPSVPGREG